jgi:alpha-tubulin suppressor-like RCC1 family protein
MPFPSNPANGQTATLNNINYQFDGTAWNRLTSASTAAPVVFSDNLIPSANVSYDIGTETNRFRSLYLSGNTIDLGGATIKTDATTGAVAIIPSVTVANPNPTALVISPSGATTTVATTGGTVSANAIATASDSATAPTSLLVSNVQVANSSYTVLDDTAVDTAGGYVVLTGSGFNSNSRVIVNTVNATSTSYVSPTVLRAQVPALAAATYNLYVVDSATGATAIRVNGITYSAFPAWSTGSTLANQNSTTSFGVNLAATSDSTITYANTTALPAGTTLAANGFFYGTVTIGTETTYSFDVRATDVQNQDTSRTFSLTVTIGPAPGLYSWGNNNNGQLGEDDTVNRSSPVQVGVGADWSQTSVGQYSTTAIKTNGTLWAWGRNSLGTLGTNDTVYRSSPVQIGSDTNWSLISGGSFHVLAIKTNGTLWAWGRNNSGQLGFGNTVYRSSPVQIGSGTNWSKISCGQQFSMAITTNGTLWAWGANADGQLGFNNRNNASVPAQLGAGTDWSSISANERGCVAIKTNGSLWGWGNNAFGALGTGDQTYRSSPVQVGSDTNWSLISSGYYATAAIKTNGTLWLWGYNSYGELGTNDRTNRNSPTQMGTTTNWYQVNKGNANFMASKNNGSLWAWGNNYYGQLGLNDTVNRSSPVQVGTGTTWSQIGGGPGCIMAIIGN